MLHLLVFLSSVLGGMEARSLEWFEQEFEQHCKVYSTASEAQSESQAEQNASRYARDRCWSIEREVGRPTTLTLGARSCVSKSSGQYRYWNCTFSENQCCYRP